MRATNRNYHLQTYLSSLATISFPEGVKLSHPSLQCLAKMLDPWRCPAARYAPRTKLTGRIDPGSVEVEFACRPNPEMQRLVIEVTNDDYGIPCCKQLKNFQIRRSSLSKGCADDMIQTWIGQFHAGVLFLVPHSRSIKADFYELWEPSSSLQFREHPFGKTQHVASSDH